MHRVVLIFVMLALASCSAAGAARVMDASVSSDGRELMLSVDSCNADLSAEVAESPSQVVVTVTVRNDTSDDCADVIVVTLDEPLGERQLLNVTGAVVPVRTASP
jgi:hypothetical protein